MTKCREGTFKEISVLSLWRLKGSLPASVWLAPSSVCAAGLFSSALLDVLPQVLCSLFTV